MTKNEIKEFTDIVTNSTVFRVENRGWEDRSKKFCFFFIYKTDTQRFQFRTDGDTEDEARQLALKNILARFRAMEPKKNWSRKVLEKSSQAYQEYLVKQKKRQEKVCLINSLCNKLNSKLDGVVYPINYDDCVVGYKVKKKADISFLKGLGINVYASHFCVVITEEIAQKINEYFRENSNKKS